ncbi:MAG: hypothetical protein ABL964_02925 [Steroidobacteraceae bacterium]
MKAMVLSVLMALALSGCASEEILGGSTRTAKCWLGEVSGPEFANVMSICAQDGMALLSNHFKNPGGFPTTCDSEGVAKPAEKGQASFAFGLGTCDNGRMSGALSLSCRQENGRTLACRFVPERNLAGEFRFTRFEANKT